MFYYSNDIMLTNKSTPDNNLHPFHCITSSHNKSKQILLTNYINSNILNNNNILYDNILNSNNIYYDNIPFNTIIYGCIYMNKFLLTNQNPLTNKASFINYLRVCMVIASKYTCEYIIDYSILLSDNNILNTDNNINNSDIFNYEIIILSNINYNLIVSEEEYTKTLVEYFIKYK